MLYCDRHISFITAISIGFEQERYTVFEAFDATGELIPIPVIKGNNLQSDLQFDVVAHFIDGTAQQGTDTTTGDYFTGLRWILIPFPANDQRITFTFELIQDQLPEDAEDFTIELMSSRGSRVIVGQDGGPFARTTVVIIDDDS